MVKDNRTAGVETLYADDLSEYLSKLDEKDYLLVDVREPLEYEEGHIPGAKLIPLGQVESRLSELDADKQLLFYCASGGRSRIASLMVAESGLAPEAIINVMGGFLGWDGKELTDFPKIDIFKKRMGAPDILKNAMNLEKGAWRFYRWLVDSHPDSPFSEAARTLVKLEHKHAEVVHRFLVRRSPDQDPEPFAEMFQALPGDILESGDRFEDALAKAGRLSSSNCAAFAELALDIEYNAYELYRSLANDSTDPEEKDNFFLLAEQEKGHIRLIAGTLKNCFSS